MFGCLSISGPATPSFSPCLLPNLQAAPFLDTLGTSKYILIYIIPFSFLFGWFQLPAGIQACILSSNMRLSTTILAASCGLAAAHGDIPLPKLFGARKFLSEFNGRHGPMMPRTQLQHTHVEKVQKPEKRQSNTNGQCGYGYGSCAVGYCCSSEGFVLP